MAGMTIAYVLGQFPVLSETFIGNEIRALTAKGYNVVPIALHKSSVFQPEDAELASQTFYCSAITEKEAKKWLWRYAFWLPRALSFTFAQTKEPRYMLMAHAAYIADYIRKHNCTHVHAHYGWGAVTYAIAAARILNLPVTFTCHGPDVYAQPADLSLKCTNVAAIVGVAPSLVSELGKIAADTPCHVVHCGVDITRFRPPLDWGQKHNRWLFVGQLEDCKGLSDILAAWAMLPPDDRPHLDIIGDGEVKAELMSYCDRCSLTQHVHFLGAKPASWIAEHAPYYLAFVAAFKQGKDGRKDTAPLVLKEAMAMALPIVTTDFMDISDLVGKDCAILCPVSSAFTIAEAVKYIRKMPQAQLKKMGEAGRKRVEEHYSLETQGAAMGRLFEECQAKRLS